MIFHRNHPKNLALKRYGQLIDQIACLANLQLAWLKARKAKVNSIETRTFGVNLNAELRSLHKEFKQGSVPWGPYHHFLVHDPKPRRISAAPFRSRVAQHALMNLCEPAFESYQIFDSYACRQGKGQNACLARALQFSRCNQWYLKLDVRKYFDSVQRNILMSLLKKRFKDSLVLTHFNAIIFSPEDGLNKGIPIGNITSQYFANHYLGLMDHFIKEQLRCQYYVRYMDDFVLWADRKSVLMDYSLHIEDFLHQNLDLSLKPACLNQVRFGMSFLGFKLYPQGLRLTGRSRQRFRQKIQRNFYDYLEDFDEDWFARRTEPLLAFVKQAASHGFRSRILKALPETGC